MKPVKIGNFLGINNRVPDYELADVERGRKAGDYLRNAVNVDLTTSGTIQRREGTERVVDGTDCHSLWASDTDTFYVDGDTLYRYPRTVVRTGLTPGRKVSYVNVGEVVYWSNGAVIERIIGGVSEPVGVPVPNPAPSITATTGGALPVGAYQVAITAVSASDEESGSTWPVQVQVPEGGSIQITGMQAGMKNIYVSPLNGDVLFLAASTTASTYTVPVTASQGAQLTTLGLRPMPPGHIVRYHNGRLLVAAGNFVYYSEPYGLALHNPARGYIPFQGRVTVLEPLRDQVFVVADQTYALRGKDIDKAELIPLVPYGAVEGTSVRDMKTEQVWWFSDRGLVMTNGEGNITNVQEKNIAVDPAAVGASVYREQNGVQQLVTSLFGKEVSRAGASSYMDAEVVRKESML